MEPKSHRSPFVARHFSSRESFVGYPKPLRRRRPRRVLNCCIPDANESLTYKLRVGKIFAFRDGDVAKCPLTSMETGFLQEAMNLCSCATERLATHLHLSPHTIHGRFKGISEKLGTHGREAAVFVALREGWIRPNGYTPVEVGVPVSSSKNTLKQGVSEVIIVGNIDIV